MEIREKYPGVYQLEDNVATVNLRPQVKVYGEKLVDFEDKELRIWDPRRSKLAAAIRNGLVTFPFKGDSKVLYLGASAGTTPSHLSDILVHGSLFCVEFSPRMMRELLHLSRQRDNLIPILDDATKPHHYQSLMEEVDVVYCDVAQPRQTELFMDNMRRFLKEDGLGIIAIKSRSIDVTQRPKKIFRQEESKLKAAGFRVLEKVDLEPYEKDHRMVVCEFAF
ncbi:fibrillarin-like rRNA/tRNA 2'-O-methyltransferase [Methanobacterium sp. CWC-01]|uniref:fibrillarin-like rRNA/tRNA 2'-O-methyltransferase n=1 Tax=Methanobacterium aridiramus TaxID=2584467 RepID=UPI002578AF6D|nr:fibrillarin-like rRNA/tRNA 2'-O-methyltransferase [Methanobacterium sp. CWC-01]WJI09693.1 fibrillarin-like rRNA/tRNA 2'-O-methyltransferase [Methanobacterium sp. CWC-01]